LSRSNPVFLCPPSFLSKNELLDFDYMNIVHGSMEKPLGPKECGAYTKEMAPVRKGRLRVIDVMEKSFHRAKKNASVFLQSTAAGTYEQDRENMELRHVTCASWDFMG
jgi:hypothetical protein